MGIIKEIKNYFRQQRIEDGKKLWAAANKQLPAPKGVLEDDEERIALFKVYTDKLTKRQLKALKAYIQSELEWWSDGPWGMTTATIEAHFSKWRQIYSQHLEILERYAV